MAVSDFLLNTDFPLNKVVYLNSGSFPVADGASVEINVPHGLTYRPLLIGTWSLTSDFSISYEQGTSGFTDLSIPQLTIQSTPTTIRFIPLNFTGSTVTFYWRVFGFMPSDVSTDSNYTASVADTFTLSSDYNYTKLWQEGFLVWSNSNQVINHNFGYRPQIEVWYEEPLDGTILTKWSQGLDSSFTGLDTIFITDTQIIFNFKNTSGVNGRKYYYHVYADTGIPS